MTIKRIFLTIFISLTCVLGHAQSAIVRDFQPVCDTLSALLQQRNGISNPKLRLNSVMKRGSTLDFYFTESLCDCPWYEGDPQWFRSELKKQFPEKYSRYSLGKIFTKKQTLDQLVMPGLGNNGKPTSDKRRINAPRRSPIVTDLDAIRFSKGMEGRHIALWQSHGRFYDVANEKWDWQRPCLFQTVEDMFTQSFVLPYLVPMLENSGAYVMLPRERDTQKNEVIADNDPTCGARGSATYEEEGSWSDAGTGFADKEEFYTGTDNPFRMGTARKSTCVSSPDNESEVIWTPDIPERGRYAVYVSYKTLPNSTSAAAYLVRHMGGTSRFTVNQKMGGGTWVYLGTFEFEQGEKGFVSLSNVTPDGHKSQEGKVVTADAVRFGGGMGNIARNGDLCSPSVSGMARSAEGARYWLQWAGVSEDIYSQNDGDNDYRDDFMSRGDWVDWISGGSDMNPANKEGLKIPVDLAFGFHSDAGVTPNDSIVGTLAIYTLKSEGNSKLPNGESRYASREYADQVQSQIVNDIREFYEPEWSRRWLWDRSYRESRTPSCPSMLLELLSHQNFADMKYGLDPTFRFTVSRAVYKGMLKYLSNRYGCDYVVQPLPVSSIGVSFSGKDKAEIRWIPENDETEPTAKPEGFILYTRIDDGGFDNGTVIRDYTRNGDTFSTKAAIKPGHVYSFRIVAYNEGGMSFPSEVVSIGRPSSDTEMGKTVLIVNNFDRISGPAFMNGQDYAGFENRNDSGVPYGSDISFIGDMYQFRRDLEWISNENPGFGGSFTDRAGEIVAGNTFDYAAVHGKAVMQSGYPFISCSNELFCTDTTYSKAAWSADIICGKQVTTVVGSGRMPSRYTVFSDDMQNAIRLFTQKGGNVLVSGAYIATDIWDRVYPVQTDSLFKVQSKRFAEKVLGYRWGAAYGSRKASVNPAPNKVFPEMKTGRYSFHNEMNEDCYCVENPDGLIPASKKGAIIMRYTDTNIPAGICHQGDIYRTACFGFPLETLKDDEYLFSIISSTLQYFSK